MNTEDVPPDFPHESFGGVPGTRAKLLVQKDDRGQYVSDAESKRAERWAICNELCKQLVDYVNKRYTGEGPRDEFVEKVVRGVDSKRAGWGMSLDEADWIKKQLRAPIPMTTLLFIDIDGPLHKIGAVQVNEAGELSGDGAFCWIEPLMQVLEDLPHVEVVVHSSWRLLWKTDEELRAHLPPELAARVVGTTSRDIMSRHASIEAYCAEHNPERFVVLDDEPLAFPEGFPPLIACHPDRGLSDPVVVERLRRALSETWS